MKTLIEIHRDNKLDIPYPALLRNTRKLMTEYPNDIIEEGNDITIDEKIIHIVIDGIEKKSKYTRYTEKQWTGIIEDYLENDLTQTTIVSKYNLNKSIVEERLKGLKKSYKKTLIDNKKKDKSRTNQIEGNFNNRFKDW